MFVYVVVVLFGLCGVVCFDSFCWCLMLRYCVLFVVVVCVFVVFPVFVFMFLFRLLCMFPLCDVLFMCVSCSVLFWYVMSYSVCV